MKEGPGCGYALGKDFKETVVVLVGLGRSF